MSWWNYPLYVKVPSPFLYHKANHWGVSLRWFMCIEQQRWDPVIIEHWPGSKAFHLPVDLPSSTHLRSCAVGGDRTIVGTSSWYKFLLQDVWAQSQSFRHPEADRRRPSAPSCWKEEAEVVQVSGLDASWTPSFGGVLGTSNWSPGWFIWLGNASGSEELRRGTSLPLTSWNASSPLLLYLSSSLLSLTFLYSKAVIIITSLML